jgi:hypothetical protein
LAGSSQGWRSIKCSDSNKRVLLLLLQGLLLPLCASRSCTLREAVIFSSVLRRSSLPVLHSAAALLRLAQLEYCGTTSFFIRVLLDKKYALPYKVRLCALIYNRTFVESG